MPRDDITAQHREIQEQLATKPHLVSPDIDQVFAIAESITLDALDDQAWRDIIEAMVDRIVIDRRLGDTDGRIAPASITVLWKPEFESLLTGVSGG